MNEACRQSNQNVELEHSPNPDDLCVYMCVVFMYGDKHTFAYYMHVAGKRWYRYRYLKFKQRKIIYINVATFRKSYTDHNDRKYNL